MNIKIFAIPIVIGVILCTNSCKLDKSMDDDPVNAPANAIIKVGIGSTSVGNKETYSEFDKYEQITKDNPTAAVEIEKTLASPSNYGLDKGICYKIVAYKKNGEKYFFQQSKDFVAGDDNKMELNKLQNYSLIIYSLGTSEALPNLSNQDDFDNAFLYIGYADENTKSNLLYQRIDDFIPDGRNSIDIRLESKTLSKVRFVVDASDFYGGNNSGIIKELNNIKLSYYKYKELKLKISDSLNNLTYGSGGTSVLLDDLKFDGDDESSKKISEWVTLPINAPKNSGDITLVANITVDGMVSKVPYSIDIKGIKPGLEQTVNLKLELCGVNFKKGWRQFMCHDLGADYSVNPFKGDVRLHGTRYQWAGVKSAPPFDDMSDAIDDTWINTPIKKNNTEEESRWGGKNPCPSGYRIPYSDELKELSKHKFRAAGDTWNRYTKFSNGFELENSEEGKLFFSTSGYREQNGDLHGSYDETNIWSLKEDYKEHEKASEFFIGRYTDGSIVPRVDIMPKNYGFSVRCISNTFFDNF